MARAGPAGGASSWERSRPRDGVTFFSAALTFPFGADLIDFSSSARRAAFSAFLRSNSTFFAASASLFPSQQPLSTRPSSLEPQIPAQKRQAMGIPHAPTSPAWCDLLLRTILRPLSPVLRLRGIGFRLLRRRLLRSSLSLLRVAALLLVVLAECFLWHLD